MEHIQVVDLEVPQRGKVILLDSHGWRYEEKPDTDGPRHWTSFRFIVDARGIDRNRVQFAEFPDLRLDYIAPGDLTEEQVQYVRSFKGTVKVGLSK